MAEIRPFRGWFYDRRRVDPSRVLAPPYDVIDDSDWQQLSALDPHNCVRLILPEGTTETRYGRAAELYRAWKQTGVLARSETPAVYRYHQVFAHPLDPARAMTRRGFVAAVRLHEFRERIILPHERTLKGPKVDRLALMDATRAHFSQIFTLYSDPAGASDQLFEALEAEEPLVDGRTADGTQHRLWAASDPTLIAELAHIMKALPLYIADGHHRYETMLALRDRLAGEVGGELDPDSSARFGTLFVANMDDEGMVVLPTHRLVHDVAGFDAELLLRSAAERFEITEVEARPDAVRAAVAKATRPAFAVLLPGRERASVLELRADAQNALPGVLGQLDVTVLHRLVLDDLLGIDAKALEAKTNIHYLKNDDDAFARTRAGEGQACFFMRATPVAQVKAISDAGEFMPQKSTFFVPKIASGIVFRDVDPAEPL